MANTHSADLERGSSQYFTAADSASLSITGNLTIEAWIKRESAGLTMTLFTKWRDSGSQKSFGFDINSSDKALAYISSDGTTYTGVGIGTNGDFSTTGTWMHIAFVYTAASGKVEVFKNGVSVGSNSTFPTSIYNSTETFAIGRDWSYGQYFDGMIDEVRVWNTARTGANILADYQTQLTGSESNLQAYWKLDNALTDTTANSNTLTNVNTIVFTSDVPFGAVVGPANLKSYNTNLKANIKSIDTNLIANVKTLDTNA